MNNKFEFKDGMECPFCDKRLHHTGEYDSKTGEPIVKCSNNICYFSQVDFK